MSSRILLLGSFAAFAAGVIATAACSNPHFGPYFNCAVDNDASPGVQGVLTKTAGDGLTAAPGAQLDLSVQLLDIANQELCQKRVTWTPAVGSGSVTPTQSITDDAHGQAGAQWTLGFTPGVQTLTATVENSDPALSVVFTATITASGTDHLAIVSGDGQTAPSASAVSAPLVVKFVDASDNPGPATTLTWLASGGGAPGQATTTSNGGTGLSQNSWTLGLSGTAQTLTVSEPGGSSVVFTATATPVGPSHPRAEIRGYNGTLTNGVTLSLQTPYDGLQTLGPLAPNTVVTDSLQVESGVAFTISSTIGGKTGSVVCTTTAAIIPSPADTVNTGNALVAVFTDQTGTPVLSCNGNGWH